MVCFCVYSSGVLGTVCGAFGLRRGSQSDVLLRFSSGVLGTVCGAFGFRRGSQSAVCLRVFERRLRGIWVSEGVAKCCVFCVFSSGYWERSAGSLGILRGDSGGGGTSQTLFFGVLGSCFGAFFLALYLMNGNI